MKALKKNKNTVVFGLLVLLSLLLYWYILPDPLFDRPTSTVITDRDGDLLGAKIADDGQWRFPHNQMIPEKFKQSILLFEDQYFYRHPGINPVSLFRALYKNIQAGMIVSGGSTLTMQVIRLSRKGKKRTIREKLIEMILAVRLETTSSKERILALYASNAPFGGNVVGLDAASWRYFARNPEDLSWAESAMLAVLPNSPSLIHPGRNRDLLLDKRNRLLDRLYQKGKIDSITCVLSKLEPIPEKPLPLPSLAPHVLSQVFIHHKGSKFRTTIDKTIQTRLLQIVEQHHNILKYNEIHNAACLVLEVETGDVLGYVGNTSNPGNPEYSPDVDIIKAPRSTGSILKPVLYTSMLHHGEILPGTLVPDVPTYYTGYTPKNFSFTYDGAVPARRALERSLNIPSVRMLQKFGLSRFYYYLEKLGISTLNHPAEHYGLSLILGGAEGTLWDITGIFCSFARVLNHYEQYDQQYIQEDWHGPNFLYNASSYHIPNRNLTYLSESNLLSAGSIWTTFQSLLEVNRPAREYGWKLFESSRKVAWKTGTSFGFRDGWAVGTTPEYTIGVWTGNADGEGRPGLIGVTTAAPILFDVLNSLPNTSWFESPLDELPEVAVCRQSGHLAGRFCPNPDTIRVPEACLNSIPCPYHQMVHLTPDKKFRVNSDCAELTDMIHEPWFVLPPVQEWYYQSKNPDYRVLPPMHPDCVVSEEIAAMDLIYPKHTARVYIPYEMDGSRGQLVLEAAHRRSDTKIYWHIDDRYLGMTQHIHQMGVTPEEGKHMIVLVDELGNVLERNISVMGDR